MFDVIVVGGGPAGLSAALMLGRCRRRVLLCDLGRPRNRYSKAVHGFLTRDGIAPAALTALGRDELSRYGIDVRAVGVENACRTGDRFEVSLLGGGCETSRFLLIATGVVDELPPLVDVEQCYGRSVFHCPYCDAWEWQDRRLAVIGTGSSGVKLALSLRTWSSHVLYCSNGSPVDRRARDRASRNSIEVRTEPVRRLEHDDGMLTAIRFQSGDATPCDALFFTTGQRPQSELAVRLGCSLTTHGTVRTGTLSNTNVPGVFVAGDASRDAQFVVVAAAEGVKAALAINQALQRAELLP